MPCLVNLSAEGLIKRITMNGKAKVLKYILLVIVVFCFTSINFCLAQGLVPDGGKKEKGNYQLDDLVIVFVLAAEMFLKLAGSLALLAFIIGGVMMIISSGNKEKVQQAKQILVAAVVGLIIVFSSYLIIQFSMKALGLKWEGDTSQPEVIVPEVNEE